MAKAKSSSSVSVKKEKKKVSRPGIHSKNKSSKLKSSKNYKKRYRGQGR
jgi:hypothetical protein